MSMRETLQAGLIQMDQMQDVAHSLRLPPPPSSRPKGCSTEGQALFSDTCRQPFEGLNRHAWIDTQAGYCHLCQEPVSSANIHASGRDHTSLLFFMMLYVAYPRHDFLSAAAQSQTAGELAAAIAAVDANNPAPAGSASSPSATAATAATPASSPTTSPLASSSPVTVAAAAAAAASGGTSARGARRRLMKTAGEVLFSAQEVLEGAAHHFPALYHYATDCRVTERLHTNDDAVRRAELQALLFYLSHPPHMALSHALQGQSPQAFWYSGERMWKAHVSRIVVQIYPPMSAGMMTNFTQKCWGRSNGERMYDALQLDRFKSYYGWGPNESKERKAFFLRHLIWELLCAEVREEISEETRLLLSLAIRRLAFEMVYIQSMDFMDQVQQAHARLGYPSLEQLRSMRLL